MFLNLTDLRAELRRNLKRTGLGNDRLDLWLNMAQDDVAQEFDLKHLRENVSFTATANFRKQYIRSDYLKVHRILDTTNDRVLYPRTEEELDDLDPDQDETGTPFYFALGERAECRAIPTAASTVRVVSSSAADNTQKVRIVGYVSGVRRTELLTLNGTTQVTSTLSYTFPLLGVKKDSTTTGVITVSDTTSTTTLSEIAPEDRSTEYQSLMFYPIPSAATSMIAKALRHPIRMINVEDSPDMPHDFHEMVLVGGKLRGLRDGFFFTETATSIATEWDRMVERLKRNQRTRGDSSPVIGGGKVTEITNLPSSYPAE